MMFLFPEFSEVSATQTPSFRPDRIVSGGQTGVDRGAFDAAIERRIEHGGACPAGRLAEDGRVPDCYRVTELASRQYRDRTLANVIDSDATLILHPGKITGGTSLTRRYAREYHKPLLCVSLVDPYRAVTEIRAWLAELRPSSLNIAGPRESTFPGIQLQSKDVLLAVWPPSVDSSEPSP